MWGWESTPTLSRTGSSDRDVAREFLRANGERGGWWRYGTDFHQTTEPPASGEPFGPAVVPNYRWLYETAQFWARCTMRSGGGPYDPDGRRYIDNNLFGFVSDDPLTFEPLTFPALTGWRRKYPREIWHLGYPGAAGQRARFVCYRGSGWNNLPYGHPQMGQPVVTPAAQAGFAGRVFDHDGTAWVPAADQRTASPDVVEESVTGQASHAYRPRPGDYHGPWVIEDLRRAFNQCTKFVVAYATGGGQGPLSSRSIVDPGGGLGPFHRSDVAHAPGDPGMGVRTRVGTSPPVYHDTSFEAGQSATAVKGQNTFTQPPTDTFGTSFYAAAQKVWLSRNADPFGVKCNMRFLVMAGLPGNVPPPGPGHAVVFDGFDSGYSEGVWSTADTRTGVVQDEVEYFSGEIVGTLAFPPAPDYPSDYGSVTRGWSVSHVAVVLDFGGPGGFTRA